jgi:alpha-galactosidase
MIFVGGFVVRESYIAIYTALFELFDELRQQFPELYIDCCYETDGKIYSTDYASRKHFDGGLLSIITEPYPLGSLRVRNMAWNRTPAMPASSIMISQRGVDTPEGINELRSQMGCMPLMVGDLRTLTPERIREVRQWSDWIVKLQNKYDYDLFRQDLPGFGEPVEGAWDGFARINTDTGRGGIVGIFRQGALDNKRTVFVGGLIPDKTYSIKPDPSSVAVPVRRLTGRALAENGFEVQLEKKYDGIIFELELIE